MVFVILHYKNLKDTIECIDSIHTLDTPSKIVVVDNATLSKEEKDVLENKIDALLLMKENLGYARGNNEGCLYAIKNWNPDFIAVINNDTIIHQKNFIKRVEHDYKKTNFDMLGPKILTDGGESVNPFPAYTSLKEVEKQIQKTKRLIRIYQSNILRNLLKLYIKVKRIFKKPIHLENGTESKYDVALHGCAIIFSKKYLDRYETPFYRNTFLYHEEEFLEYRRIQDHLVTYYDCDLEIFHKEGASLECHYTNQQYQKLIFQKKEILKSLELLKNVMKNKEKI